MKGEQRGCACTGLTARCVTGGTAVIIIGAPRKRPSSRVHVDFLYFRSPSVLSRVLITCMYRLVLLDSLRLQSCDTTHVI